nr:hypothetical protein BaRGS_031613 [Batillaria attramentaria]
MAIADRGEIVLIVVVKYPGHAARILGELLARIRAHQQRQAQEYRQHEQRHPVHMNNRLLGALYNISRSGCDIYFFHVMMNMCSPNDLPCILAANGYYIAVVVLGNSSFSPSGGTAALAVPATSRDVSHQGGASPNLQHFLPLVILFLCLAATKGDYCAKFSEDGCTAPDTTKYKQEFTPACNRHDACYGCGALHEVNRKSCDQAFLSDMKSICRNSYSDKLDECLAVAQFYFSVVDTFGWLFYRPKGITGHCDDVVACLPS